MMNDDEPTEKELAESIPKGEAYTTLIPSTIAATIPSASIIHSIQQQSAAAAASAALGLSETEHSAPITQYSHLNVDYLKRRYRKRHENPEKIQQLVNEYTTVIENLNTAVNGKMEMAVVGILNDIIIGLDATNNIELSTSKGTIDGGDRQRALFRVGICPLMAFTLQEMGGAVTVCERALQAIAYMCRYSDEIKTSTCLENCKGFGTNGVCELMIGALKRHHQERAVIAAICDGIRCMCALESNRERFGRAGACEAVTGCLIKSSFSMELQTWLCRTIGHLANGNDNNREVLGGSGACQNVILSLQKFQSNMNLCTECCWAIRNLALNENNRARFANDNGPESIMAVFQQHLSVEAFAAEACKAIVSLISSEDDDIIPRIANSGFIKLSLKALKRNTDSEVLCKWVFHAMYYMAWDAKSARNLINHDVLEILSGALDNHAGYELMAEWSCNLVHKLLKLDNFGGSLKVSGGIFDAGNSISNKMRSAGLCEMVVAAVQRQAISMKVSSVGSLAIGDLAIDKLNQSRLSTAGACEAVVGALRRHSDSAECVFNSCFAVHHLADSNPNYVSWMGANGACEAVTNALSKHANSEPVAKNACNALASLSFRDEGNQLRIFASGGCLGVVNALKKHGKSKEVCEYACKAIYNLCAESQNVSEFSKKKAANLVVDAMQAHANQPEVVTQALLAMHSLAVKAKTDTVHKGNTKKLVSKGAIENSIAVMQKFMENEKVQRAAAMAIASLGRLEAHRDAYGSYGACELLIHSLKHHIDKSAVINKLALAIDVLSNGSEPNKSKFVHGGVVELLLDALVRHEKVAHFVADALRAIITLSSCEPSKTGVHSEQAFKQYVKVMRIHEKNDSVAKWGCHVIHSAATDNKKRAALGNAKACEEVIAILMKHGEKHEQIAEWGCKAVVGLSLLEANQLRFQTSDITSAVVMCLKTHHKNPVVVEWACSAVVCLALSHSNRSRLGSADAFQALSTGLQHNLDSEQVTCLVFEAVFKLAAESSNRSMIAPSGINDAMVSALSKFIASQTIVTLGCKAITNVSAAANENSLKLCEVGVCELLVSAIQKHYFSVDLLQWALSATSALCNQAKCQNAFHAANAVEAIAQVIQSNKNIESIAQFSTKAIRALSLNNKENQSKVSRSNIIIPACIFFAKLHILNQQVVEHSAWIIANIEYIPNASTSRNSGSFVKQTNETAKMVTTTEEMTSIGTDLHHSNSNDGIFIDSGESFRAASPPAIVAPTGISVEPFSTVAVKPTSTPMVSTKQSTEGYDTFKVAGNSGKTLYISGVPALYVKEANWEILYAAAVQHKSKPDPLRWLCAAISMFAEKGKLSHPSICDLIISIVEDNGDKEGVIQKALFAVGALARSNADNNERLASRSACELIDQILANRNEGDISIYGVLPAIQGLAEHSKANRSKLGSLPLLCKNVSSVLYNELETDLISQYSCAAISALTNGHRSNQQKFSSVCLFVSDVITTHKNSLNILTEVCKVISRLAHSNITNRNKLGASNACATVMFALNEYVDEMLEKTNLENSLLYWGVRAIADLAANNPNNQAKLGIHGACELLVKILGRDPYEGQEEAESKLFAVVFWAMGNLVQLGKGPTMIDDSTVVRTSVGSLSSDGRPLSMGVDVPPPMISHQLSSRSMSMKEGDLPAPLHRRSSAGSEVYNNLMSVSLQPTQNESSTGEDGNNTPSLSGFYNSTMGTIGGISSGLGFSKTRSTSINAAAMASMAQNEPATPNSEHLSLGALGFGGFVPGFGAGHPRPQSAVVGQSLMSQNIKNTIRLLQAGAAEWLVVVMMRLINNALVAQWGCRAINNMSKSSSLKAKLIENGALEVIDAVFERYSMKVEVTEWAALAKETLAAPTIKN